MTTLDLTSLLPHVVGSDRIVDWLENLSTPDANSGYPPYNIERHSNEHYRITMAVAGFKQDDLKIILHEGMLCIQGNIKAQSGPEVTYLHRGIATRAFKRRFKLADSIQVESASLADGFLHINLKREIPESMKPQEIPIGGTQKGQTITGEATEKQAGKSPGKELTLK